jgi:hypothetical protein
MTKFAVSASLLCVKKAEENTNGGADGTNIFMCVHTYVFAKLAVSASLLCEKKAEEKTDGGADASKGEEKPKKRDEAADCTVGEIVAILGMYVCVCVCV